MKILLVEDDARLSRSLARLLEQDRHNVEVAPDGETGLDIALGENGIDVVILDIGLPDISGLEVARRIRERAARAGDPDAHRPRHGRRPGVRARFRRRRLRREAVQLRRARRPPAGPRAADRERRPPRRAAPHRRADQPRRDLPDGHGQRPPDRPQPARVLAPRVAPAPHGPGPEPRPAARSGLAIRCRGDAERRRRLRPLPPDQARPEGDRIETVRGVGYRLNGA